MEPASSRALGGLHNEPCRNKLHFFSFTTTNGLLPIAALPNEFGRARPILLKIPTRPASLVCTNGFRLYLRVEDMANDAQPTNVTSTSESVSANTSPQLGIRPKPLVSSRSLLRIGLLKSRNAAVDTVPGTNVENQTALLKARRKMTKRASSLSDFFHSSTGTPNRPLPASSLAAAARDQTEDQHCPSTASSSSSLCCSALRRPRHKNAILSAVTNAAALSLPPHSAAALDLATPEYGAKKQFGKSAGDRNANNESTIMHSSEGYGTGVEKQLLNNLQPNSLPTRRRAAKNHPTKPAH
ncbi:hypothetical protein DdX_08970 [Ditylenchus destructor]|uniref:Uncharacterized protein n=1 Tax=Ditylenchus destructor TaxID=166010 RepID=A0AAD4N6L2_9BILA|nr:hypothetical protein DdX_08970 [Ditylenchus destructor]